MSISPFFYIEKWNSKEKKYKMLHLYTLDSNKEYKEIDFWPFNGSHDLFSLLGTTNRNDAYDAIDGIKYGDPGNLSEEVSKIWNESESEKYGATLHVITLAELKIEILTNPTVKDYDADWGEGEDFKPVYKETPLKSFFDRVINYVNFANSEDWSDYTLSDIRIVYWTVW